MQQQPQSASQADVRQIWSWNAKVPEAIDGLLHGPFLQNANEAPNALAMDAWDRKFTYAELDRCTTRVASHLVHVARVEPGMLVPMCFEKSAWATVAMLSILKAGAAFVPLDPNQPALRRENIMGQLGDRAPVAIASASHAKSVEGDGRRVVVVGGSEVQGLQDESLPPIAAGADRAAYCLFTSGSTGEPKGVVMQHGAVVSSQMRRRDFKGYGKDSRVFQFSSYTFDTCIDEIFMTLGAGGCVCVPSDDERMNRLASTIHHMSANVLEVTTTVAALIHPDEIPSVKTVIFGGEFLSHAAFAPWNGKARVINTYGPTECCVDCAFADFTATSTPGLIGTSAGSNTWIVDPDDHNRLAPIGSIGELLIEGPVLASGYLNSQEQTAKAFIRDPEWLLQGVDDRPGRTGRLYKTGDLARYTTEGNLVYIGRKDTQVKIHGQRVELGEIESHISDRMPRATRVIAEVVSYPDDTQALVAFLRIPDEKTTRGPGGINDASTLLQPLADADALQNQLFEVLARYMVPTTFFTCQDFPMTTSGKIDRKLLRKEASQLGMIRGAGEDAGAALRPISSRERKLQQIWADVLKMDKSKIRVDDSFFHLGGDSVAAIKLAGQARKQGIRLAVVDIFQQPKLCDLAAKAASKPDRKKELPVAPFSLLAASSEEGLVVCNQTAASYNLEQSTIQDMFPCTPLQEGMLSLTGRDSSAGQYMIQKVLRLSRDIDTERFRTAWETVVEQIPILRTRLLLAADRGTLVQAVVSEGVRWKQARSLDEYLQSDRAVSMGMGDALARYAIVDDGGQERSFVWTIHHCLYDGWTMPRMLALVERAYAQRDLCLGQQVMFSTFIKHFMSRDVQEAERFWTTYLDGAEVTKLPKRLSKPDDPTELRGLVERCRPVLFSNNKTHRPSTLIRAAFGTVLSQLTGSGDVVFGTTVSGRQGAIDGIEDIMGPTIATVPVRIRIDPGETREKFLDAVQDDAIAMVPYEHHGIQNIAGLGSSCRDACNFQTYLVIQQDDPDAFDAGILGQWQQDARQSNGPSTYPIMVECFPQGDGLNIQATFDPETFSSSETGRIIDQFFHDLEQLLEGDLARKMDDIEPVSPSDLQRIMTWNNTVPTAVEETLHNLALRQTREKPDITAIEAWDGRLTYAELDLASSHVAKHLVQAGVGPDVMVPMCFEKSVWAVVAMIAILKTGGAFVPLDPRQPMLRREKVAEQVQSAVMVASAANAGLLRADGRNVVVVGPSVVDTERRSRSDPHLDSAMSADVSPGSAAYVLFTSGSTGEPKGVVVQHRSISSSLLLRAERQGFGPHSRVLQFASYTFDVMLDEIFMTLLSGGCVCVPSDEDIMSNLSGCIRDLGVNTVGLTPTVARLMDPDEVPDVTSVMLWGEGITQHDLTRWSRVPKSHTPRLQLLFGPTECCVICAQYNVDLDELPQGSPVGKAVVSVAWVVNAENHDKLVPIGGIGELLIEGPAQARWYLNDQAKTDAAFIYDPEFLARWPNHHDSQGPRRRLYKTGDLVRYDDNGNLIYMGRKDTQVKLNGQRVELGEVETQVSSCVSGASHVLADIFTLKSGQRVLAAFIQFAAQDKATSTDDQSIKPLSAADRLDIENKMSQRVPRHMIPSVLFAVRRMPRNVAGKLDRRYLREEAARFSLQDLNQEQDTGATSNPMTESEKRMQMVWSKILDLEPTAIHVTDTLFQLGGHSVTAMKVAAEARKHGMDVTVADIFRQPRLRDLAAVVKCSAKQTDMSVAPFSLLPSPSEHPKLCREINATHGLEEDAIEDLLPCTPLQEGLLSLTSRDAGDYMVQRILPISEHVSLDKIRAAWEAVVRALPILRTRLFLTSQHGILQGVLRQGVDWTCAEGLEEYLQSDMARSTRLGDPLTRYAIVNGGSDRGKWLVWTIHHSLYDAWMLPRILDMVERVYRGESLDQPVGFGVFIKYLVNRDTEKARSFWKRYLSGARRLRPIGRGEKAGSPERALLQTERATRFISKYHVPATFINAAVGIVLGQLADGVNDVTFASTVFGRNCPVDGIENVMGPTIATVPVRVQFRTGQTVRNFLDTLQEQTTSMMPYEHEGIQNIRRMSKSCRNACEFKAYVVVQQGDPSYLHVTGPGPLGKWQDGLDRGGLTTYPIMMECHMHEKGFTVRTSVGPEVASEQEIRRIMDRFHSVLEELLQADPASTLERIITPTPTSGLEQIWARDGTDSCLDGNDHGGPRGTNGRQISEKRGMLEPVGSAARKLQHIWAGVLGLDPSKFGMEDNFFHLGGDSVVAMKIAAAARASGWSISVSNILRHPTMSQQLPHFSARDGSEPVLAVPPPYSLLPSGLRGEIVKRLEQDGLQTNVLDILPATDFQNRTVIDTMLAPETALNYISLELGPSVSFERLQYACNALVKSLEILRTVFVHARGRVWQVVLKSLPVALASVTALHDDLAEIHDGIWRKNHNEATFDHPTVSFSLVRSPGSGYSLVIGVSHAQYDGLSVPLILRVLESLHNNTAPPETFAFSTYLMLQSNRRDRSSAYWRTLLKSSRLTQGLLRLSRGLLRPEIQPRRIETSKKMKLPSIPDGFTVAVLANFTWALLLHTMTRDTSPPIYFS